MPSPYAACAGAGRAPAGAVRAHRPRREVPLDAGHQVPVGHHLTQMLGPVIGVVQYPPRPDDTPGVRSRLDCRTRLRAAFKVVFRVACLCSSVLFLLCFRSTSPCVLYPGRGGVVSDRVYRARPGRQYPDGLDSCGGGPSDRPSRSLRVVPADFCPGARSAHPGPFHLAGG